jgi:tetratricopeptide (TPR) repeat protein
VRETLERVLASETFGRSERARKLLRYLVEREQDGEADRLKGFSIAVDVFGKDADFDSATDAVVRVQAGRLRELLQQYSATEGAADPVQIVIPRGSYVPAYEQHAIRPACEPQRRPAPAVPAFAADGAGAAVPLPSIVRQLKLVWLAFGLVVAMLGVLIFRQNSILPLDGETAIVENPLATASIASLPSLEALPLIYLAVKNDSPQAARVTAALRAGLPGFDTVDFIGRDAGKTRDVSLDPTSFIFDVLPGAAPDDVAIEIQNVATGRVLLSRNLAPAETAPGKVEDRIAGILSATVLPSGAIYGYIEQAGIQTGLTRCMLLDEAYYLDQNAKSHKAAYRCLETLAEQDAKSSLVYSELASLHLEAVTDGYAYPPDASFDKATALAHKAVLKGATSAAAHRAYGYLNSRLGNSEESIRWMRKAYELNTYDLSMAAAYGYGLIFAGRYGEGTPIMARAVEASSAHPTWWDFGLFLGAFMQGDPNRAARAASALTTTAAKSHYLAARLISAKATGNDKARQTVLNELVTDFPKFAADPRKAFAERKYPADLTDRLVAALRGAGLGGGS